MEVRRPEVPKSRYPLIPLLLLACGVAHAQKPVIYPNGVVNAASLEGSLKGEALLVGGSVFSILGENLAVSEQYAPGAPLPKALGGTSVTVDGIDAPLFFVSPGKINFQVPYAVSKRVGERIPVSVTTSEGTSDPVLAFVQEDSPATWVQGGGACGQGLIQHLSSDGSMALNSPDHSLSPGSFFTVFGTGLGVRTPPDDGQPALDWPPIYLSSAPTVFLLRELGHPPYGKAFTWSIGLVPGLVGVTYIVAQLDDDAQEGCAVPLRVGTRWGFSPPVAVSIRKGGGPCQDAPPVSFANLNWRKVVTFSPESPSGVEEASFTGSFSSAPENLGAYPDGPDLPFGGCRCGGLSTPFSPRCPRTGLTTLDAGTLTLAGLPGEPVALPPSPPSDETQYSAALPPGSLEGGILRITTEGGADVGPFETEVTVPPPIQITTPLAPGTVIDFHRPFIVNWTGGQPDTLVRMRLIAYNDQEGVFGVGCDCPVLGAAETVRVDMRNPTGNEVILDISQRSENAEVVVTVTPLTSKSTRFGAPGLTLDGKHAWSYEYRFKGLKIR